MSIDHILELIDKDDINKVIEELAKYYNTAAKQTMLHHAIKTKNAKVVQYVLNYMNTNPGISIDAQDKCGNTALHYTCSKGTFPERLKIMKLLLENKASPNIHNAHGNTPLHGAVLINHASVRLLIDNGADPNAENKVGETPTSRAAKSTDAKFHVVARLACAGGNLRSVEKYDIKGNARKIQGVSEIKDKQESSTFDDEYMKFVMKSSRINGPGDLFIKSTCSALSIEGSEESRHKRSLSEAAEEAVETSVAKRGRGEDCSRKGDLKLIFDALFGVHSIIPEEDTVMPLGSPQRE